MSHNGYMDVLILIVANISGCITRSFHSAGVSPGFNFTSTFQSRSNKVNQHTASNEAKRLPMHTRGPAENPKKLSQTALEASEAVDQREGLKVSGEENMRGLRAGEEKR